MKIYNSYKYKKMLEIEKTILIIEKITKRNIRDELTTCSLPELKNIELLLLAGYTFGEAWKNRNRQNINDLVDIKQLELENQLNNKGVLK